MPVIAGRRRLVRHARWTGSLPLAAVEHDYRLDGGGDVRSAGGVDAAYPDVLVQGADGNLYGSALAGGANGGGAIFKITL